MNRYFYILVLTEIFLVIFLGSPLLAQSDTSFIPRLARASDLTGKAYFQGNSMFDWEDLTINTPIRPGDRIATDIGTFLELELDDGNFFRLSGSSKLDVIAMDMNEQTGAITTQLRLLVGDFYGQVMNSTPNGSEFLVEASMVRIKVAENAVFRVTVFDDQTVQIQVHAGAVQVSTFSGTFTVQYKQMITIDPQGSVGRVTAFEWWRKDDFDIWNESRMEYMQPGESNEMLNQSFRSGWNDLDHYGRWIYVKEYGDCWVPTVSAGWVPYRYGRWSYMNPWGWTWVSHEPWGWIPYHYGSWTWSIDFGWFWVPGYYWSPGWVSWHFGLGYVGWVACHPWDYGYRSFSVNYCGWFPYHCRHYGRNHYYHHHHNYHQNGYHRGRKYHNGNGKRYVGDSGDYGRKSFWQKHLQNYGESVPINATHRIGVDSSTTINAAHFFNQQDISESTPMFSTNVTLKQRNWVEHLPELDTVTSKTGISQTSLKKIQGDVSPGSAISASQKEEAKTNWRRTSEADSKRQSTSTSKRSKTSSQKSSPQSSSKGTSNKSRIAPSLSNSTSETQSRKTDSSTQRSMSRIYTNRFRSGSTELKSSQPTGNRSSVGPSRSGTTLRYNSRSSKREMSSNYGTSRYTGKYRSYTPPSSRSQYRIPQNSNGIKGVIDSFRSRSSRSPSGNPTTFSKSQHNSSSSIQKSRSVKSGSSKSPKSSSSSSTKSRSSKSSSKKSSSKSKR